MAHEISVTVNTSAVALGMLDAEISLASARVDAATAALKALFAHRQEMIERIEAGE